MASERLVKLRYQLFPDHLVGEVLSKRWIDNVPALIFLAIVVVVFGSLIPNFFLVSNLVDTSRQLGEIGLVVLAMTLTVLSGGIDLSVGSNFGLANIVALILIDLWQWPFYAVVLATLLVSGLIGLVNGILVG